ncbi:hypothetical protein L1887_06809 [Cichorium endivia]|nr:hypothetical protein L1887_06809 [Cichorium endivia]
MENVGPDGVIEIEHQDEKDYEEEDDDDFQEELEVVVLHDDLVDDSNCKKSCKGNLGSQESEGDEGVGDKFNEYDINVLFCPICMEAWSSDGEHQI